MSDFLELALGIATDAHHGQSSKTGAPFIEHVRRVADAVVGHDEKIVACLHDVVEKSEVWDLKRLRSEGFPEAVLEAVDAMTKREGEEYFDFVQRSIRNALARPVKRADLKDNLAQMRQVGGDGSKYEEGLRILEAEDQP